MTENWSLYHPEIPEFLRRLAETPPMARLRQVGMNCGCEYTSFPRFAGWVPYSRFDHSVGVGLIVWHFTGDLRQSAAGLLHDAATPAFAHVVDFLHGDHLHQESTEARTAELIETSPELQALLKEYGLTTEDVADYHRYPIADNDSPQLSADRLEYTLGDLRCYGFAGADALRVFYEDLTVWRDESGRPELAFRTRETACAFTQASLQTARVYVADEDRFAMQALADLLRDAVNRQVLTEDDLYRTESFVIQKLEADPASARRWRRFRRFCRVERSAERPENGLWFRIPAKLRIRWWRALAASLGWTPGCGRPRRPSWPRTLPAGSVFRRKPPERMIEKSGERDMDFREKAVRCVRETVLPVQAAQFRACGCDLDAQYRKYGDTESFFAKVLQPGRLYEVGYPKCVCPEVLRGETADAAHCECSRQSVLYILEQLLPERHITVRTVETVLGGGTCCRFAVTVE